jgi:ribosome-associated translation inhibitor RaiA
MGFLTTFTIYNDDIDRISKNPKEFVEKLIDSTTNYLSSTFHVDGATIKAQGTRHSSETVIYVQSGNTTCLMNASNIETEQLMNNSPEFFEEMLNEMENQVIKLKAKYKEIKNK